jgi:hypothetical protein
LETIRDTTDLNLNKRPLQKYPSLQSRKYTYSGGRGARTTETFWAPFPSKQLKLFNVEETVAAFPLSWGSFPAFYTSTPV